MFGLVLTAISILPVRLDTLIMVMKQVILEIKGKRRSLHKD